MLSFQHADLRRLYDYWSARGPHPAAEPARDAGLPSPVLPLPALPSRHDIDPIDLGWMLDRIALLECHDNPLRFRCRVAGTWFSLRLGFEASGAWLHDWPNGVIRDSALSIYRLVHGDGRPYRIVRQFIIDGVATLYEGAVLPLGAGSPAAAGRASGNPYGVAMLLVGAAPIAEADLAGLSLVHEAAGHRSWASA